MQSVMWYIYVVCVLYCAATDGALNEPAVENTVHTVGDIRQHTRMLDVDCNENKHCVVTAMVSVTAKVSDDDCTSGCTNDVTSNTEASSKINRPVNICNEVYSQQVKGSVEQTNETLSDTCVSQNATLDPLHDLQNTSIRLCDSFYGSDSDPVSQSQGPQLTNTQKVKIFAMELDMMKAPVSAPDSENSLFDSLVYMSSPVFM